MMPLAQDGFARFFGENPMGNGLLLAGMAMLCVWLMMRRRVKRPPSGQTFDRLERAKQMDGMKNELHQMMVDLEEMARRVGAQIDAKQYDLEKVIDEARRTMERLERVSAQAVGTASPTSAPQTNAPALDPFTRQIYELADAGKSAVEIASQLNEQTGKVELVLALRQSISR